MAAAWPESIASAPIAYTFSQALSSEARGDEGCGGIEQDDVAASALDSGKDVVEESTVGFDVAADKVLQFCAGKAGHFGSDASGFEVWFGAGFGLFDARDYGLAGGGEFVDPVGPVHDEGAL